MLKIKEKYSYIDNLALNFSRAIFFLGVQMNLILIWLLLSCSSGILYRAGGMDKGNLARPKWIPVWLRQSWIRDWLIPLVSLGLMLTLWQPNNALGWISLLPCIALNGAALSTYWDWLFGYDNFYFHGFGCGLALLPLIFAGLAWQWILVRAIVLGLSMGLWSFIVGNDEIEEYGRGLLHTLTIPIILI
jgi:hypothetical protein